MRGIILFTMIFLHIVDDYYLQGVLAKMKQKKWWDENNYHCIYKHDYIIALIMHAFSWTFCIMIPSTINAVIKNNIKYYTMYFIMFIINWFIHTYIDNLKANKYKINLTTDQIIHLIQIIVTWFTMFLI